MQSEFSRGKSFNTFIIKKCKNYYAITFPAIIGAGSTNKNIEEIKNYEGNKCSQKGTVNFWMREGNKKC